MNTGHKTAIKRTMRMLFCTVVLLLAFGAMLTFTVPMQTLAWAESEEAPLAGTTAEPAAETEELPAEAESPAAETEEPSAGPAGTPAEAENTPAEAENTPTAAEDTTAATEDTTAAAENTATTQEEQPAAASAGSGTQGDGVAAVTLSGAAAGEDNPAEPEPSIPEDQVEVEAYAIPAGSVYIHEISKEVKYSNSADNNGNAINEAFADALTYLGDLYRDEQSGAERTATIVVQDGLYLDGVNLSRESGNSLLTKLITDLLELKTNSSYGGDLTIRIVAHDAIVEDEQGKIVEINAGSQGNVKLEGGINIDIDGINLMLAGLYLSTRDTVSINNAGSVEYYGTVQDDSINLNVSNIKGSTGADQYHIILDSGAGNDTVNVEVRRRPNVSATVTLNQNDMERLGQVPSLIDPGTTFNDVLPYIDMLKDILVNGINGGQGDPATVGVNVKLGDGEDTGSIRLIDASDVIVSLLGNTDPDGIPLYTFGFAVDMGAAKVTMDGGDGEDRLSVTGGRDFSFAQDFMKAAIDFVTGELDGKTLPASSILLSGGQGDDLITVDTTAPYAAWGSTSIEVTDQAGYDRLHLTGKLNNGIDEDKRISVSADGKEITLESMAQIIILGDLTDNALHLDFTKCFKIFFQYIESLTDALLNKRTVAVEDLSSGDTLQSFTNYVVTPEEWDREYEIQKEEGDTEVEKIPYKNVNFDLDDLKVLLPEGGVLFSNLILTDNLSKPISGKLGIDRLNAGGLNLLVTGEQIDVFGPITAKNIILSVYAEDEALAAIDTSIVKDDLNPGNNVDVELGFYEADRDVYINIVENQKLRADQVIDLNAQLVLNKGFIPGEDILSGLIDKDFNPVTLKFGNADITIYGNLSAGGYIHARSDVDITIDATNEVLSVAVPITLAVSSGHSRVTVGKMASLVSGDRDYNGGQRGQGGILVSANSVNDLAAYTMGGSLKFSIALAVVEFETIARITDYARIDAGGALKVLASSIVDSTSYATGKPSIVWNVDPQSGVFIAGNFIFNTTKAVIDGSASVSAMDDVVVYSFSDVRANTVSLGIPLNDMSPSDQMTVFNRAEFMAKLLSSKGNSNKTSGALAGSNGVGGLFKDATSSAGSVEDSANQVMGALGIAYIDNANLAKVDVTKRVSTPAALRVHATGSSVSSLRADGSLYRTPSILGENSPYVSLEAAPKNAIGAAIAIGVFMHSNEARVSQGAVSAKDLSVKAQTLDASSSAVSKAGHTPDGLMTKLGIGGAVTVHVANVYNSAVLSNQASYELDGGDVEVISTGSGRYATVADASGKRARRSITIGGVSVPLVPAFQMRPSSAGVGAGIAVEVMNIDAVAEIEDGISFGGTVLGSLKTEADYKANFYIQAAAGSTGGVSVAPVMALTVSSVNTKALVGELNNAVTEMSGELSVTANTEAVRKLISDAKAVGSRAGVGAAVGLSILDDSAVAELKRSVKARSVQVAAESISRISQNVYASAAGASASPVTNTESVSGKDITDFDNLVSGKDEAGEATPSQSMNKDSAAEKINKDNAAALGKTADRVNSMSGKNGSTSS